MATPAGWYDDPELVNTRRYWDGAKWTEHRQETVALPTPLGGTGTTARAVWELIAVLPGALFGVMILIFFGFVIWALWLS